MSRVASLAHSAYLALVGHEVPARLELILKSVRDHVLHVLQFTLQVFELFVVVRYNVLVLQVFVL